MTQLATAGIFAAFLGWVVFTASGRVVVTVLECPYLVSTSGGIHGAQSPYRGMVVRKKNNCFRTKAAAREYARSLRE